MHGAPLGRHCASALDRMQHSSLTAWQDDVPHVMLPEPLVAAAVTPPTVTPPVVAATPTPFVELVVAALVPCATLPPAPVSTLPPLPTVLVSKMTFPPQLIEISATEGNRRRSRSMVGSRVKLVWRSVVDF